MKLIEIFKKLKCSNKVDEENLLLTDSNNNNTGEGYETFPQSDNPLQMDPNNILVSKDAFSNWLDENKKIILQALIYASSDAAWSGWSYAKYNYAAQITEDESLNPNGQWFGQLAFTAAVTIGLTAAYIVIQAARKKAIVKEVITYAIAASLAICIWQLAQLGAEKIERSSEMPDETKKYFDNFIPTPIDGLTEALILFIGNKITNTAEEIEYNNKKEFALNTFSGTLASVLWQLLYMFSVAYELGAILTATLVACPLIIFNIASGILIERNIKNTISTISLREDSPIQSNNHETEKVAVENISDKP